MLTLLYKSSYVFVLFYYAIIPLGYLTKWWVTVEKMKGNSTILVTGGAGYVGSHTVVELLKNNYTVIALDNNVNCYAIQCNKPEALKRVEEITGEQVIYYKADIRDKDMLDKIFKAVMSKNGVKKLVFSSSATVYGDPQFLPITEQHPTGQGCTNPYGKSKYFTEEVLKDVCTSDP
ncbi:unnamed protein product, partial [Callosobruchus maculatus]